MEHWVSEAALSEISKAYQLEIRAVLPMRSVVGLVTTKGKFMCKRYGKRHGITEERLRALIAVKDQLAQGGVCPTYRRTKGGEGYILWDEVPVTVEPWVNGRHADFTVAKERLAAAQAVARLHRLKVEAPFALRHPPTLLQKLSFRLDRADDVMSKYPDLVGLSQVEWQRWRERALRALRELPRDRIARINDEDRAAGVLCHRDLAPHNILVQAGRPACLIDFDLAGLDARIYDLYQLMGHVRYSIPHLAGWEDELFRAYARIAHLSDEHVRILSALTDFPSLLLREIGDVRVSRSGGAQKRVRARIRFAREVDERRVRVIA